MAILNWINHYLENNLFQHSLGVVIIKFITYYTVYTISGEIRNMSYHKSTEFTLTQDYEGLRVLSRTAT